MVLTPLSNSANRDWPAARWQELAESLFSGRRVEVIGTAGQGQQLRAMFGDWPSVRLHIGEPVERVLSLIASAKCVVGNDSGICHVAGLYSVPTVCVQGDWPVGHLHSMAPSVKEVRPLNGEGLAGISADRVIVEVRGITA